MEFAGALQNDIYLAYVKIILVVMVCAGLVLLLLTVTGRDVSGIWKTYRGWLIMVPLVLGTIFLGREAVIVGVALLSIVGFKEFARATGLYDDWWLTGLVYAGIIALAIASFVVDPRRGTQGWFGLFAIMPAYVIPAILLVPVLRNRFKGQLQQVSLAIVGFIYFGWMFSHLGFVANATQAYGYLLYLVFAVELNDIAAFTFGRLFGRHKLRSAISPNKTIEGALGAIAVSLALPFLMWFTFPHFGPGELIIIGLVVGIGGQMGDLTISFIKRDIGIKDMGTVIQGHGGVLDRIDSLIFVVPILFHIVRWSHGG